MCFFFSLIQTFDVYEFCTDALQKKLRTNREQESRRFDVKFAVSQDIKIASVSLAEVSVPVEDTAPVAVSSAGEGSASVTSTMIVDGDVDDEDEDAILQAALAMSVGQDSSLPPLPPSPLVASASVASPEVASASSAVSVVEPEFIGSALPTGFTGLYELHSIVSHKGRGADSGHYIGWVRQSPGSQFWWKYDDDKVSEVDTEEILNLKGGGDRDLVYLVFYRFKEPRN